MRYIEEFKPVPKSKSSFEIYREALDEEVRKANKTTFFQRIARRLSSFWDWYGLPVSIFGGLALLIGVILYDGAAGTYVTRTGLVVDKHYKPATSSSTSTVGSNGKVYSSTSSSSEKFLIMVKTSNGQVFTTETDASIYYSKNINDRAEFEIHTGKLSGITWSIHTLK